LGWSVAVLSIDLGGSHMAVGVVHNGVVVAVERRATEARLLATEMSSIAVMARRCLAASGSDVSEIAGVAIGFCGVVDGNGGEILSTLNKYTDALDLDLHGWAQSEFGLALRIENDACLALLGEVAEGAARGERDVVMVTLGTGIGGAAMIEGRLLRSRTGQAGCLGGHLPVNFAGRQCSCGAIGCAETEASTAALPELLRRCPGLSESVLAGVAEPDFKALFHAADAGDAVARSVLNHCVQIWSVLTVGLVHAYGSELVLFGGGVSERGASLLDPIRSYVESHIWRTSRGSPRIERAQLGQDAALIGGATLFQDKQR
jgi:glucokinase